ncbi:MAG: guanylate kinase [Eubacterium sp.]|nr:guanylate kinase [Eubacterium sp.]
MKKGKLLVISGFSGVGKGTVVNYLKEHNDNYKISVSVTTRNPRENEINGIHYHFITNEQFENMITENKLLEYAGYVDHYYGTPKEFVEESLEKGNDVILEIETKGALQVKENKPDAILIFILPPSAEELKNRLVGRQTETEHVINERLKKAAEETDNIEKYDYYVLNDEVDKCAQHIENIKNNNPQSLDLDFVNQIKSEVLMFAKGDK